MKIKFSYRQLSFPEDASVDPLGRLACSRHDLLPAADGTPGTHCVRFSRRLGQAWGNDRPGPCRGLRGLMTRKTSQVSAVVSISDRRISGHS